MFSTADWVTPWQLCPGFPALNKQRLWNWNIRSSKRLTLFTTNTLIQKLIKSSSSEKTKISDNPEGVSDDCLHLASNLSSLDHSQTGSFGCCSNPRQDFSCRISLLTTTSVAAWSSTRLDMTNPTPLTPYEFMTWEGRKIHSDPSVFQSES